MMTRGRRTIANQTIAGVLAATMLFLPIGGGAAWTEASAADVEETTPAQLARIAQDLLPIARNLKVFGQWESEQDLADLQQKANALESAYNQLGNTENAPASPETKAEFLKAAQELVGELDQLRGRVSDRIERLKTSDELPAPLRERLGRSCENSLPQLLEYFKGRLAESDALADGESSELREKGAAANECQATLDIALRTLTADIRSLNDRHATVQREIEALQEELLTASPERQKQIEEEIKEKQAEQEKIREKIRRKEEVAKDLDALSVFAAMLRLVVGGALLVATGGSSEVGWALVADGTRSLFDTIKESQEKEERWVDDEKVVDGEGRDLAEDTKPDPGATAAIRNEYEEKGWKNITSGSEGNFMVMVSPTGTWLVLQVQPRVAVATITPNAVEIPATKANVTSLNQLSDPRITGLKNLSTTVTLDFSAKLPDGSSVEAGLTETGVRSGAFVLSIGR